MLDPIYRLALNHLIPKCFENLKPAFTGSNSVLKQSNIILKFSSKLKKMYRNSSVVVFNTNNALKSGTK